MNPNEFDKNNELINNSENSSNEENIISEELIINKEITVNEEVNVNEEVMIDASDEIVLESENSVCSESVLPELSDRGEIPYKQPGADVSEHSVDSVYESEHLPVAYDMSEDSQENKEDGGEYFSPIYSPHLDIVESKTKPRKKKRHISVFAACVAMFLTMVISVVGSVFIVERGYYDKIFNGDKLSSENSALPEQSGSVSTIEDNINNSKKTKAMNVNNDTLTGDVLTTPQIVDKVGPAVVGIVNKTTYGDAYGYYGFFGNLDEEFEQSSGSGVIISSDGYIVTNHHVIENASKLVVILNNGQEYEAKIVGGDSATDLAVIKIEAKDLVFAQMGISSDLRVGEKAIAIGNPLGQEFAGTTTEGIISGLNRSVTIDNKTMNLIQTDAAINPGNSGGALVNEKGLLIGINTAKISSNTLEGLGFAIPIDEAKPIIEELYKNGYVSGRPVIGIAGRAVTKQDADAYNLKVGVYVSTISPNGPAHMSGVKVGDIIVECDGEPIETVDDINEIKNKKAPGDTIKLKIYRRGEYVNIDLILGEDIPG